MRSPSFPQSDHRFQPPAAALVATSGVSGQCGSALATKLFPHVGPSGTLTLRLVVSAVLLVTFALVWGRRDRHLQRILRPARRSDLAVLVVFGLVLAGMNLSFYESIARIPLGVAVTVEFVGPLAISVAGSRRWTDGLWALLAGAGVLLLAGGSLFGIGHRLDIAGVGFAVLAGSLWAAYIIFNKETGKRFEGTSGLAGAMCVGALVIAPVGVVHAGAALFRPAILGLGAAVALLSSTIPYSCEMVALRRATPRAFGILLSISPALAALAGLAILGQRLSVLEVGALVLVVGANVGSSWLGTRAASAVRLRSATSVPAPGAPPRSATSVPASAPDLAPDLADGAPTGAPDPDWAVLTPAGSAPLPATPATTARP